MKKEQQSVSQHIGERLDFFLSNTPNVASRSQAQKIIAAGLVFVNQKKILLSKKNSFRAHQRLQIAKKRYCLFFFFRAHPNFSTSGFSLREDFFSKRLSRDNIRNVPKIVFYVEKQI